MASDSGIDMEGKAQISRVLMGVGEAVGLFKSLIEKGIQRFCHIDI